TVREFISEFDGLTSSAKQKAVLERIGLRRAELDKLRNGDGLDLKVVGHLLAAMKAETRPVNPSTLGAIGRDHLEQRFQELGSEMATFRYRKLLDGAAGLPSMAEIAFAYCPATEDRRLITGVNWSPGIVNPFRKLGRHGESLDSLLQELRVGPNEPV